MKILLFSDSHGYDSAMMKSIEGEQPFDMLFHLGDIEGSELKLQFTVSCGLAIVRGNCDGFSELKEVMTVTLPGGHKALLTHGHRHGVNGGYERLILEAKKNGCDVICFGHTHKPLIREEEGILLLNPGSITRPKTEDGRVSYMVLTADPDGTLTPELKYPKVTNIY